MNAGLLTDLPSLEGSGAEGVGLYRTELQFLIRARVPMRGEQAALYDRVLSHARGKRVVFRTLDIGSDKVLPYMKKQDEPNPALGWRAIRISLDRPNILKMQVQSLLRGAAGRPFAIMFPMVTQATEFTQARDMVLEQLERHIRNGWPAPHRLEIGAMLETPSLAFAPDRFFREADFISIGGNDLKQFFFAADRGRGQAKSWCIEYFAQAACLVYISACAAEVGILVYCVGALAAAPMVFPSRAKRACPIRPKVGILIY